MEPNPRLKKLSNIIRLVLLMLQKGASKSKTLTKSINDIVIQSHTAISCRPSNDVHTSFVSPTRMIEYEFSCSSSPVSNKRKPRRSLSVGYNNTKAHWLNKRHVSFNDRYSRPVAKPVRVADVDEAADEFIDSFYRELWLQKWVAHDI